MNERAIERERESADVVDGNFFHHRRAMSCSSRGEPRQEESGLKGELGKARPGCFKIERPNGFGDDSSVPAGGQACRAWSQDFWSSSFTVLGAFSGELVLAWSVWCRCGEKQQSCSRSCDRRSLALAGR